MQKFEPHHIDDAARTMAVAFHDDPLLLVMQPDESKRNEFGRWFLGMFLEIAARRGQFWGNEPKGGKRIPAVRDRWICAELMIRTNTLGKADGEQAFWIDGKCAGRWGGYRWRKHEDLKVSAVWLLYYVTGDAIRRSKGDVREQHVLFDDIVVATDYIGPQKRARSR